MDSTTYPTPEQLILLNRLSNDIEVCKRFINANDINGVSFVISGIVRTGADQAPVKRFACMLSWTNVAGIAVEMPITLLYKFMQEYGDQCYTQKLRLEQEIEDLQNAQNNQL